MPAEVAREAVLREFRWVDGHADVWRLFRDPGAFRLVIDWLCDVAAESGATRVAGIESRGFILGGAVAAGIGIGFVPIRKEAGLFPGPKRTTQADADYRGIKHRLRIQQESLGVNDRVLLVDDWAERGSQAVAARSLIDECDAEWGATRAVRLVRPMSLVALAAELISG